MSKTILLLKYTDLSVLILCVAVLVAIWRKNLNKTHKSLSLYLLSVALLLAVEVPILFFRKYLGIAAHPAYQVLFYSVQVLSCVQSALILAVIYNVFQMAMRPLKGLHRMGTLIFKWVAGVSVLLGVVIAFGPHVFATGSDSTIAVTTVIERAQEGINVLTLCLLLFVCLSIRPLGLTMRSHVFGVALGLGIISTTELVQAAWFWTIGAHNLYSLIYLCSAFGYIAAFTVWGGYFMVSEPARKMLVLPTTSPFFHWNRISEALGDAPGNVAVGFNASMISPIETMVMTAMSRGTRERATLARVRAQSEMDSIVAS